MGPDFCGSSVFIGKSVSGDMFVDCLTPTPSSTVVSAGAIAIVKSLKSNCYICVDCVMILLESCECFLVGIITVKTDSV